MRIVQHATSFLLFIICTSANGQDTLPLFSFGLIADAQYADADTWGKRDYRGSLKRLETAVDILNQHNLSFVVHAGDLIDRYYESYDLPLRILNNSRAPVHYVIGNHEFSIADSLKSRVRKRLNNPKGYYSFAIGNIQFILLDAMDVSVHSSVKGSRDYEKAVHLQAILKSENANNAADWNGAVGEKQMKWLKRKLKQGGRRKYRTILFSHLPLLPENGLHLWNNREVLALLNSFSPVVAFISGHHHEGGYVKEGDIHHLTLKGLVESRSDTACAVAEVFSDRIVIRGFGDQKNYTLEF